MRKLLLATTAAALALTFADPAGAEPNKIIPTATTVAPPETTSTDGLVFSKDANQARPIDKPGEQAAPAEQAQEPVKPIEAAKPTEPATPAVALSPEDTAVAAQLKELVETKLSQYVPREQDRAGVLTFYKARNFAPIWIASGKPAPRADQAKAFLKGVAADGLDPADYVAPSFTDPAKLAVDELALTNSVITFARHASIGRVAFTRVSGAVYYDQKAPNPADVLGKLAESTDVRATLDAFNPQAPAYKALKAQLADVRSGRHDANAATAEPTKAPMKGSKSKKGQHDAKAPEEKPKAASADTIIANMERWRWMPHDLGAIYVMVNIPDYTLKVVKDGKTVWSTKIVVGKPGDHATPLLTETMKFITVNPTWNVPPRSSATNTCRRWHAIRARCPASGSRSATTRTARSASSSRRASATRSAASASISRTASWSISTTRRTRSCSLSPRAPTATAACGCRIRMNTPRCCSDFRSRRRNTPRRASGRCTARASALLTSSARSQSTSPIRPRSSTTPAKRRRGPTSMGSTATPSTPCAATAVARIRRSRGTTTQAASR